MFNRLFIIVFYLFLNACATNSKVEQVSIVTLPIAPVRADAFKGSLNPIESIQEIFTLSQEQKDHFLGFFYSEGNQSRTELDRIYEYLENRIYNFNYHSDTLTAKDVLEKNTGNCLSLAILTKSLAQLVNMKVGYELVETPTVFQKEGNIILNYRHVRSVLYSDQAIENKNGLFTKKMMRIDYFPSFGTHTLRRVPENEFFAMFYNNKAVEAVVDHNINLAYDYLNRSLKLYPANAEAISMMGILHGRKGLVTDAEKLYQYGLTYSSEEAILLKNYYSLLIRLDRTDEAEKIAIRLAKYSDSNPFNWMKHADEAYQDKDYAQAIVYYRKAAKMANYLHEPYAGIARAKHHLGKNKAAKDSMIKALANSHKEETIKRYQSKYDFFQAMIDTD